MPIARLCGTLVALLLIVTPHFVPAADAAETDGRKAVLVTGASTGIGRKITEVLAEQGFFVYAGARKQVDLDALDALDNVEAVRLDVTVQEQIDAAVEQVSKGGRGLFGLINNAGVLHDDILGSLDIDSLRKSKYYEE